MMNINLDDVTGLSEVEPGYLLGTIHIMDVPHHVALLEVIDDHGAQRIPDGASITLDNMINDLMNFDGANEPYMTVEYHGRSYICAITPYCR